MTAGSLITDKCTKRTKSSLTYGCVGSHVVAVVEANKGEIGDVGGEGQDEKNSNDAGHAGSPQPQRPKHHTPREMSKSTNLSQNSYMADILLT